MEDELRFTWGVCAVCGVDVDQFVVRRRSMLCRQHQADWVVRQRVVGHPGFHEFVREHSDSHLLFHRWGMKCPQCIPCGKCEEHLPMEYDYLCEECRYG